MSLLGSNLDIMWDLVGFTDTKELSMLKANNYKNNLRRHALGFLLISLGVF